MKDLERYLEKERSNIDKIKAPRDLEEKLRFSLGEVEDKKPRGFKLKLASLILVVFLLGYNMDSLAQYGKRLIGYESMMKGSLIELNQLGKGQTIDKSYQFKGGESINLDGVMVDDNNMILFYTLYDPRGGVESFHNKLSISLEKKLSGMSGLSGTGRASEDGKEMKWIMTRSGSPKFYERNFDLVANLYGDNDVVERGSIPFKIDRKQAVGKTILVDINKKVKLADRTIRIKSLRASPTSTRIEGQVQNLVELGLDQLAGNRIMMVDLDLALIVNGREMPVERSSMTTDLKGMNFTMDFDTLPKELEDLQIKLLSLTASQEINKEIPLEKDREKKVKILDQDIEIKKVYERNGATFIVIASQDTTSLGEVFLDIDGEEVPLDEMSANKSEKVGMGKDSRLINTISLGFKGNGEKLTLKINRINFEKTYDEIIYNYNFK